MSSSSVASSPDMYLHRNAKSNQTRVSSASPALFSRKLLRDFEDVHRSINGCLVDSQFFVTSDVLHWECFHRLSGSPRLRVLRVSASFFSWRVAILWSTEPELTT